MHQYTVKILQFKNVHNLNWKFIDCYIAGTFLPVLKRQQGGLGDVTAPYILLCRRNPTVDPYTSPMIKIPLSPLSLRASPARVRTRPADLHRLLVIQYCRRSFKNFL